MDHDGKYNFVKDPKYKNSQEKLKEILRKEKINTINNLIELLKGNYKQINDYLFTFIEKKKKQY